MTRAQRVWLTIGITAMSVVGYVGFAYAFFKYGDLLFSKQEPAEPEHVHAFGEWTVEKEATCTEEGVLARVCECGEKETQPIDKIAHTFGEWHVVQEPTCTKYGIEERVCECGETESNLLAKTEHHYGMRFEDFSVAEDGTITGIGVVFCDNAGDDFTAYVGEADGLYFAVKEVHAATCTEGGWTVYNGYCEYDGKKVVGEYTLPTDPATNHSVSSWHVETEPDNFSAGEAVGHCEHCGQDIHVVLPALTDKRYIDSGTEDLCGTDLTYCYHYFDEENFVEIDIEFSVAESDHIWGEWKPISEYGDHGDDKWVRWCSKDPRHMQFSDSEEKPED